MYAAILRNLCGGSAHYARWCCTVWGGIFNGSEYIYQDVEQHRNQMSFAKAFEKIKDRNILCLAGEYDSLRPNFRNGTASLA